MSLTDENGRRGSVALDVVHFIVIALILYKGPRVPLAFDIVHLVEMWKFVSFHELLPLCFWVIKRT